MAEAKSESKTYRGSCHCGNVKYEVQTELGTVMSCNCSICRRKGSLLWAVPREALRVQGEDNLATYTFNRHVIQHRFCPDCGIGVFGEAVDPRSGKPTAAVNVRCLPGVDLESLKITMFDGAGL